MLGLLAIAVAATAFVPEYLDFAAGRFPIATELHIHAALMSAWLGTFLLQAGPAARGHIDRHRKLGPYALALGVAAWASMVFVALRGLVVHPVPSDGAGYDEILQDVYTDTAFIVLLLWAAYERRRPAWHKRLMVIALFVTLLAPIERIEWLPQLGIGFVWASVVWLDLCLVIPLAGCDLIAARQLHPATQRGLGALFAAQALTWLAWGTPAWRHLATTAVHGLRSAF